MVSTRAHLQRQLDDHRKALDERYQTQLRETVTALDSINRRLDLLNELRVGIATKADVDAVERRMTELSENGSAHLTRAEYESQHQTLEIRIGDLATRMDRAEGRSQALPINLTRLVAFGTLALLSLALIGFVISLIAHGI